VQNEGQVVRVEIRYLWREQSMEGLKAICEGLGLRCGACLLRFHSPHSPMIGEVVFMVTLAARRSPIAAIAGKGVKIPPACL